MRYVLGVLSIAQGSQDSLRAYGVVPLCRMCRNQLPFERGGTCFHLVSMRCVPGLVSRRALLSRPMYLEFRFSFFFLSRRAW